MIINPSGLANINTMRSIGNAYKCVDEVYMYSQAEDDCNLYVQRSYWARDPNDPFEAPNFVDFLFNIMLLRPDLIARGDGVSLGSGSGVASSEWGFHNHDGYRFGGEYEDANPWFSAFPVGAFDMHRTPPIPGVLMRGTPVARWWLTQPYFLPFSFRIMPPWESVYTDDAGWFQGYYGDIMLVPECPESVSLQNVNKRGHCNSLTNTAFLTSPVMRVRFGDIRPIHAILYYRPHEGKMNYAKSFSSWSVTRTAPDEVDAPSIQILTLPDYQTDYSVVFDTAGHPEPAEEIQRTLIGPLTENIPPGRGPWSWGVPEFVPATDANYVGGTPCVVSLDTPFRTRDFAIRWTGSLTNIQFLDSPIIPTKGWWLSDNADMTFKWPRIEREMLRRFPELWQHLDRLNLGEEDIEYIGDTNVGIRFAHPMSNDIQHNIERLHNCLPVRPDSSGYYYDDYSSGWASYNWNDPPENPYKCIDVYDAKCLIFDEDDDDRPETGGDVWLLKEFWQVRARRPIAEVPTLPDGVVVIGNQVLPPLNENDWNKTIHHEVDIDGTIRVMRDVGDNKWYVMNKKLLKWYYDYATNTWGNNNNRGSTEDQFRYTIELASPQMVMGCIMPMANPATLNRPTFVGPDSPLQAARTRYMPGVYGDFLVPHRLLLEGRLTDDDYEQWALLDEFNIDPFSAHSHHYFSYPQQIRFIRITVQEWYGNSAMRDIQREYLQVIHSWSRSGRYGGDATTEILPGFNMGLLSSPQHDLAVQNPDHDLTIGGLLNWQSGVTLGTNANTWNNFISSVGTVLLPEFEKWQARTIQSLWKGIYLPPTLFFGDNGEVRR